MSMTYTPAMIKRDEAIRAFYARGWTYKRLAERYGLSVSRIFQILQETGAQRAA